MPRLSPGQILFLIFVVFAFLWTRNPRMFNDPGGLGATLTGIAVSAAAIILAITVHEFNHAFVAVKLGDSTPRRMGRVTLNPISHLDPIGTILLFVAGFGWGKPVLFNPMNLRINPLIGSAAVSFAGPLANIVFAIVLVAIDKYLDPNLNQTLSAFYSRLIQINIILAAFNLVPIPPLDGFGVVQGLLPARVAYSLEPLRQYGPFILLAAIFLPQLGGPDIIGPIMDPIIDLIVSVVRAV